MHTPDRQGKEMKSTTRVMVLCGVLTLSNTFGTIGGVANELLIAGGKTAPVKPAVPANSDSAVDLYKQLSAEIRRSSNNSRMTRQETRALIDALLERKVDVVSLLVGECREGDVRCNSVIFEALRYVGSERSKAALLKIAQNRQYTDSYALGDRVAKAYMHLAKDSTEIAQLFSSRQPRVVDAALGGIAGCALTATAVESLGQLLNSRSSWRHYHVSAAFKQDMSRENTERKVELLLANFSRLDHLEDAEKVDPQMGFTGYEEAYGSYLSALGNMPGTDPFLLKSLGSVTQRQRQMIVMALGQRRNPVVRTELLQIVKRENDGFIRWKAVDSLRYIATKADIPLLQELAANDPYTRNRSKHAIAHRPQNQPTKYHPVRNAAREIVSWLPTKPPQTDMELADYGLLAKTEKLDLRRSRVTDAGLVHLTKATRLKQLWLDKCQVTDAGLVHLKTLTNLESLRLDDTRVTDRGLANLKGMAKLKSLNLSNTSISDAGMVHLARLINLTELGLDSTQISNAGLVHLNRLTNLELLRLGNSLVTDVGLIELKGLTKLERLILRGRDVTDAWLVQLLVQKNLTWLGLGGTRVTYSGVAELERKMKDLDVRQY
jgi:hypothetical protein